MATVNSDGTKTYSNYYNGMVTKTTVDANGKTISKETTPYEKKTTTSADGVVRTQESPVSATISRPTTKQTTATTKDGKSYTFEGDNWVDYAKNNGITSPLATAISYPNYVDAKEAYRFLYEQGDRYGVDINNPNPVTGNAVSKAEGESIIPDFKTPFASAAAGQTETSPTEAIPNFSASGQAAEVLNGLNYPTYEGFDYSGYYNSAEQAYKDSIEAQRKAALAEYEAQANELNKGYDSAAQQAYIASVLARRATEQQLKESGIKGGLTESSLLRNNAEFQNAYNENERARLEAQNTLDLNRLQTEAGLTSQEAEYIAALRLQEMQAAAQETQNINNWNMNQYAAYMDQVNADRQYQLTLEQLAAEQEEAAYNKTMNEIELAYQLGDIARLKELGYDTELMEATIAAQVAEANNAKNKAVSGIVSGGTNNGGINIDTNAYNRLMNQAMGGNEWNARKLANKTVSGNEAAITGYNSYAEYIAAYEQWAKKQAQR